MNCEECGSSFEQKKGSQRFCSERCRKKAESRRLRARKGLLYVAKDREPLKTCEICGSKERIRTDCHYPGGPVRGILCFNCKRGLGMFKDRVENLSAAVKYLGTLR